MGIEITTADEFEELIGFLSPSEVLAASKGLLKYARKLENDVEDLQMEIRCMGEFEE